MVERIVTSQFLDEMLFASSGGVSRPLPIYRGRIWGAVAATPEFTLGASQSGYKLRVVGMEITVATASTYLSLRSKPSGAATEIWVHNFPVGHYIYDFDPSGYLETTSGESITGVVGAGGGTIDISLRYVAVPA